jgi:hypothetical protein
MGFGSSFKKVVGKAISQVPGGEKAASMGLGVGLGIVGLDSAVDAYNRDRENRGLPPQKITPEQLTAANVFSRLSPEQQKDMLINNPNIQTPGGNQVYDPLTNTIKIEESQFQTEQRGRQENLAAGLSGQLQGLQLPGTDSSDRFEQGRELLQPAFTQQREELIQMLADRGLPPGSEAHNKELDRLESSQGQQLNQLSFESVQTAEMQRSARFNELASLLGQAQVGGVGFDQFQAQRSHLDLLGAEQGQLNRVFQEEQNRKQRSADKRSALIGAVGSLAGAGATAYGAYKSDRRLKEEIELIKQSPSGINIYSFKYIGRPEKYEGVIAQEIQETNPKAVIIKDGYLAVNYDLIDVNFIKYDD